MTTRRLTQTMSPDGDVTIKSWIISSISPFAAALFLHVDEAEFALSRSPAKIGLR